jgi:hypothetical protein
VVCRADFTFDRGGGVDHTEWPTEQATESARGFGPVGTPYSIPGGPLLLLMI